MSLVGTRPPTVDEYEQYELGHRKRLGDGDGWLFVCPWWVRSRWGRGKWLYVPGG